MENIVEVYEVKLQHKEDTYPIIFHFLNEKDIPSIEQMKVPLEHNNSIADINIRKIQLNTNTDEYKWCLMNSKN
jgi:hypothetical protein